MASVRLASTDPDLIDYEWPLCAYDARNMTNELPPSWEKLKAIGNIVATLGIPILLAIVANSFSQRQKEMEIGIRYVELATQILRADPSPDTQALRTWAVSIIENYSPVPLSEAASKNLEFERLKTEMQNYSTRLQSTSNSTAAVHGAIMDIIKNAGLQQ